MKKLFLTIAAAIGSMLGVNASAAAPTKVAHPDWSRNAVIYEVNTRQYTPEGTFDAFARHLPRLKELGVDILWFMPIHPISEVNRKGTLGSYYAVRDYKAVNPEFGDLAAFKRVVDMAHSLGMKVIIDWVPNHTGCDNAWVTEHPDRYARNEKGEMYGPYDWTDVYQLDYSNPDTRAAMTDAMRFWLTEAGIDGFRCDVAGRVPVDYWDECRAYLEAVKGKGNLFMLAEATEPELMQNAFDMDYNWPMKDLQNAIAATRGAYRFVKPGADAPASLPAKNADDVVALVAGQAATYPAGSMMMNMVTNHDLNSWEGTENERYGRYLPAMVALTYILPGMPLIYSGQEANLDRALQFFEKDCITELADVAKEGSRAAFYTDIYRQLNELKHKYRHLDAARGNIRFLKSPDKANVLVAARELPGEPRAVVAVMNFGDKQLDVLNWSLEASDMVTVTDQKPQDDYSTILEPGEAMIFSYPTELLPKK